MAGGRRRNMNNRRVRARVVDCGAGQEACDAVGGRLRWTAFTSASRQARRQACERLKGLDGCADIGLVKLTRQGQACEVRATTKLHSCAVGLGAGAGAGVESGRRNGGNHCCE